MQKVQTTWRKKRKIESPFLRYGILVLVLVYLYLAGKGIQVDSDRVARGLSRVGLLFSGFFNLISNRVANTSLRVYLRVWQ